MRKLVRRCQDYDLWQVISEKCLRKMWALRQLWEGPWELGSKPRPAPPAPHAWPILQHPPSESDPTCDLSQRFVFHVAHLPSGPMVP